MERVTFGSLMSNIVVIGLDGEIRTLEQGQLPKPGELIINEVSDTSELVIEQVTPQGSSINVTGDITALIEAIAAGQDPTQLGQEFESAAGEANGSSPQTTGSVARTGTELLASTNFETVGTEGAGFSTTQILTLLDILPPTQAPAPTGIPIPVTITVQDISSPAVDEGQQVSFDVTLNQPTEEETTIEFTINDGSAVGGAASDVGADYVNTTVLITLSDGTTQEIQVNDDGSFTVSLPIGEESFTVSLDTIDDNLAEGSETFSLSGSTPDQPTPVTGVATITDEAEQGPEDTVTVNMTGPNSVSEGETTSEYTVTLSDPAPVGSIVTLAYSYTTASGDDITETTQAIIGADGVTATFTIDTVDDVYAEGDEVFRVSVSGIVDSDSNPIFEALNLDNAFVDTTISDETDPGEDTVTVTMTGPANVVEGDTTTDYTVTLSEPAPVGSIVTLAYSYTTASGDDITETTQAVIGADGVTATFTIDTVDDVYAEGDEVFRVSVSGIVDSDSNPIFEALDVSNAFVDTTISDETDPGPEDTVTVTMTGPANVVEGDTTTEYTVTLSDPAPVGSIVTLAYSYTTASGDDITETTQAIIGADGVTATFTIDTVDDVYAEGDEVFRVSVSGIVDSDSNPIFEALNLDNAFVDTTISDETNPGPEDTVTVTMTGPANVVEGDTTTDYTVTLSDPAPVGSIVTLAYSYTTASGDDITETTQAVIGADGVTATFTIDTVDDVYAEGDEVFRVSVSGIVDSDSNPIFEALNLDNAFVDTTISDETDPGPEDTVTVTMTGPANVVEGDTTTDYTVTLSDPAPVGSIVTLAYSYTTASGDDITETTQAIIGADGVTATFTIDTVDDVYAEGDEVFRVSVSGIVDSDSNPIFEALDVSNAFVDTTISDETDPGPEDTVTVTMTGPANVVEGDTTTEYTVTLSDPAPVGSIVTLAYSYTTASGDDITETTQAIIGADGVTATFTIDTVDDVYAEGDEVFRVSVSGIVDSDSNPIFEALNLDNAFVDTTISDETDPGPEDTVTVTMTGPANVVEGDTTTDYTVTLSDPAPVGSIVTLAYSYTTASGDDITETTQAIIGADGVTATFTIDTVDDVYAEGDEVFRVSVSGIVDSDSNPIFEALNLDNAFVDTTISDETDPGPEDTVTVTMTGPANVVEGDTTTDYTVTLSDPAPVGSIVTLAYSYTTASGDDITETTQAIIGADGVTATFTIDTVDDVYAEGDEVFRVSVSGIVDSDSNPVFEALNLDNAFVDTTISDETDPGPEDTVTVTMTGPANVVEGDTTTDYTVTLSDPAPVGSIVTLAYSYTTASGDDITETTQAIIGADGVTATFTIDTVDDVYAEGDEVFRVSVSGIVDSDSNPIFEALNLDNAFVDTTISDETDPGPEDTVTVTMTGPANVVEGDTTTDYTVTLSDPAPVGSIVTLAYSYTTASGDDITETTQAIIGADGVTATFTIDTVDDVYAEGDEVFRVSVSGIVDSDSNPIFEALNLDNAFVDTTISDETDPGPEDTVTVTMTGPANVVEGDTTTEYTVTLSDPAPVGSIVTLAYSYTTASGDDITETTQAIIGADGVTATFTIDTVDDVYAEGDEVFRVSVSGIVDSDSNPVFEALNLDNAFVDTTISDETDPGPEDTVTVTMTGPANVVEGDTTTDYTVTLSDPAPVGSIVTLAYSYTTASGDDITETTQAIIGADGVTATFTIDTVDDVYAEGDEVFRVSVSGIVDSDSNPVFEVLNLDNAFVDTTISDETDPGPEDTVTVTMTGPANVVEGDTTTDYTVTLSDPAPVGSIVTLAYSYTTASGDDITETTQAIIGADGVTATFTIDTVDDVYAEGDEVFRVSVSGIVDSDSNPVFEALNLDNAFVDTTISDETDPGPEDTVTVTMTGPANVVEGDTTTDYTVTLSDPAPVGSIVTLAYSYTTASGDDITETTQAIIGADGVTATFTIDTVDDVYAEGDEVFRVSVSGIVDSDSNPIFEALNLDNAFVDTTISDETDPGPEDTVTVTMTGPANVVEGDTTTDYTVTLSDPAPVGSIVTLAYSYTTASGDDITETTQAIIGADGVTATFTIDTVDDVYAEGDEVFRVSVSGIVDSDSNPIFEALNLDNAFVDTTISDETDPGPEDTVTVTMTGPANVVEGDTTTEYTVTLSDPAPVGSIVTLAYSYTTASGDDITETTQAIIGADGVTATFTIDTVDDVYAEGDEVFRVSVSGIVDSDSNPVFEALNLDNAFVDTTISDETDPGPEDTVTVTMTGPANVVEGDTTTDYTVTLSDPAPVGSIVTLAYSYTTASGDDITETTQAIIGADGVTATFTIDTVDDVYAEGDEVFRVSVSGIVDSDSNPVFEVLNLDNAFVDTTISDETDPGPEDTVTVTMTGPANVVEGDTTTDYTVTLSDPAPVGSIVTLAYSYTTASGDDITETTQAIIGADGVTATFTIDTVDDVYAEGDEVFRVSVSGIVDSDSNPIFEALNLDNAFVNTSITDNDAPPSISNVVNAVVSEEGLANGIPDNTGSPSDTTNSASFSGTFTVADPDTANVSVVLAGPNNLTSGGEPISWTWDNSTQTLTAKTAHLSVVATVVLSEPSASGQGSWDYTITLFEPLDHPVNDVEDIINFDLQISVSDGQTTTSQSLNVVVEDDCPYVPVVVQPVDVSLTDAPIVLTGRIDFAGSEADATSRTFGDVVVTANGFVSDESAMLGTAEINQSSEGIGVKSSGNNGFQLENEVDYRFAGNEGVSEQLIIDLGNKVAYGAEIEFEKMFGGELEKGIASFYRDGVLIAQQSFSSDASSGDYAANFNVQQGGFDKIILEAASNGNGPDTEDNSDFTVKSITFTGAYSGVPIASADGNLGAVYGADGPGSIVLNGGEAGLETLDGQDVLIYVDPQNSNRLIAEADGELAFEVQLTPSTGKWEFFQYLPLTSPYGDGDIDFNYTITDNDGDSKTGYFSVNPYAPPIVEGVTLNVSEEGLSNAIADDSALNGFDDTTDSSSDVEQLTLGQTVDSVTLSEPSTALTSNGISVTWALSNNDQMLIGSANGKEVIKISVNDTGMVSTELLGPIDHSNASGEDALNIEVPVLVSNARGLTNSTTVNVIVEDDSPDSASIIHDVVAETKESANVQLIMDVSGSMRTDNRLQIMKDSATQLLNQYESIGQTRVQIITYSSTASTYAIGAATWLTVDEAKAYIETLTAGGATNYNNALNEAKQSWDDVGKLTSASNVSYFLSDGQPNPASSFINDAREQSWIDHLTDPDNQITALAYGMGVNLMPEQLDRVAYDGFLNQDLDGVVVPDVTQLPPVMLQSVIQPVGGNLMYTTSPDTGIGADGGYISEIEHDGVTYSFDGTDLIVTDNNDGISHAFDDTTMQLTIYIDSKHTLEIDLNDGAYAFYGAVGDTVETLDFDYVLTDNDGDQSENTLQFVIDENGGVNAASNGSANIIEAEVDVSHDILIGNDNEADIFKWVNDSLDTGTDLIRGFERDLDTLDLSEVVEDAGHNTIEELLNSIDLNIDGDDLSLEITHNDGNSIQTIVIENGATEFSDLIVGNADFERDVLSALTKVNLEP
ncbi:VWA domain-containing protein [Vibrio parahaemolyticus]|uniref:VWA domain-containing protein n=80 Tax=Vibrio parahaemolyticus TaxID=670 RepID=UPI003CE45ABC